MDEPRQASSDSQSTMGEPAISDLRLTIYNGWTGEGSQSTVSESTTNVLKLVVYSGWTDDKRPQTHSLQWVN